MQKTEEKELVNRVAQSGLITIQLEDYFPEEEIVSFDFADYLFRGLILREKDFRDAHKAYDWASLEGKYLAVHCSTDAIIPMWAHMLVSASAAPFCIDIVFDTPAEAAEKILLDNLSSLHAEDFSERRVILKGCSDRTVSPSAYIEATKILQPVVQSLMFGEPCSTVPVFKRPRKV
ncbi:MAG: DUF2480 family protein [Saprospiraceae bacterium]|nr:DUF2480 family protein [Saprospiraceae bacterium]